MTPYTDLRALIDAVRRRWLATRALSTVGLVAAVAALPIAVAALAGWSVSLEGAGLIVVVSLALCAAGALSIGGLRRWPHRPSDVATARFIEEQAAANLNPIDAALVSAIQVGERTPEPDPFVSAVVAQAASRLSVVTAESIVGTSTLRYSVAHAAAGTLFLGVAIVCALPTFGR